MCLKRVEKEKTGGFIEESVETYLKIGFIYWAMCLLRSLLHGARLGMK